MKTARRTRRSEGHEGNEGEMPLEALPAVPWACRSPARRRVRGPAALVHPSGQFTDPRPVCLRDLAPSHPLALSLHYDATGTEGLMWTNVHVAEGGGLPARARKEYINSLYKTTYVITGGKRPTRERVGPGRAEVRQAWFTMMLDRFTGDTVRSARPPPRSCCGPWTRATA